MQPTNADLQHSFEEHARHDESFQDETRETDKSILASLDSLHEKLELMNQQLAHQGERLDSIETNMAPILELYEGLKFGSGALKWTSGIVLALTIIIGSSMAVVKFFKG